jgi:hypothetical protein
MRQATQEFIQEEARLRGARPRLQAIIHPFDLDSGLGPGLGVFEHTLYGGEPGKLDLEAGFFTRAAWTSPVRQTFSPYVEQVTPTWEDHVSYMTTKVFLKSADTEAELAGAAFTPLKVGLTAALKSFYQIKVEFSDSVWSGEPAGYVSGLRLAGGLVIPEQDILDAGEVRVAFSRDFSEHRGGGHTLVLDNREGQWLHTATAFPFLGLPWERKRLDLYHGWELPDGSVEWLLLYRGVVESLAHMAHGWQERHRVSLESRDLIAHHLKKRIGAPDAGGERKPLMRGTCRVRGELAETTPAQVGAIRKTGSGSAVLHILGNYRGLADKEYLIQAETTGEVGEVLFRWSVNHGQSWRETAIATAGAEDPIELEEGLAIYWESGIGTDFVAGDRFSFPAQARVHRYQVFGGPFVKIAAVYLNSEETWEGVTADAASGEILVTGQSAMTEARVVKDATTHPVDIMLDILTEVGLAEVIDRDSFGLAKSLTPDYAVGVCFENVTAAQALRDIVRRTLYDLWVDFGVIKIRAYVGEDW